MGKYDKLKGKLPAFQQEPKFQEKVEQVKSSYHDFQAADLAREFLSVRRNKKMHKKAISEANIELEALSQILVENFEASGIKKFQLSTGESLSFNPDPYSSIINLEKVLTWVKKEKMEAMLTLGYQTMNAMNKDRAIKGQPPIPGTKIWLKDKPSISGEKDESEENEDRESE